MRSLLSHSELRHRLIFGTAILLTIFTFTMIRMGHVYAAHSNVDAGKRIITIHDRGESIGIMTEKNTLRDAFDEAHIAIDKNDLVEPGLDDKLVAQSYEVNIYRARPVVVKDGTAIKKVLSAYQTPSQIIQHAGMTLRDEDRTTLKPITDVVSYGAGVEVDIDRATALTLELYGTPTTVYTQAATVGDLLKEKGITLGAHDQLSRRESTPITAGMKVAVWRNGKTTITRKEAIDFSVEQIQDADRPVGYRQIKTPGQKGQEMVTYEAIMKNGKIVRKKKIQSVVLRKPTSQVEIIGAKAKTFGGNCASWMAAAGITDMANASYLIGAESGCNPYAQNPSGACGVGQALPCSKTGCEMGDGACQTKWMNSYVLGRYGSWQAAADHHRRYGWY